MLARRRHALVLVALASLPLVAPDADAASSAFVWGADLPAWWAVSAPDRAAAISASAGAGMELLVTDAKEAGDGRVAWWTPSYPTFRDLAEGEGAVELVARDAHTAGLDVVVRFDVFEDGSMASLFPASRIAGTNWVDPACADVRAYALAQVQDLLTRVAFEELNFDHVRYPETADASSRAALPCTGGALGSATTHAKRAEAITSWVAQAAATARELRPGIRVSASLYVQSLDGTLPAIGQNATRLAPHLDILRPMIYPGYLGTPQQPYTTVFDWTAKSVERFGSEKTQPWVQGFLTYSTQPQLVGEQLSAVHQAGGAGALVWWFWSAGTSGTFWDAAAAPLDALPAERTFEATFAPPATPSTKRLEVRVASDETVTRVVAEVGTRAALELTQSAPGVWTRSMHLQRGSQVQFVATGADGERDVSPVFVWR